MTPWPNQENKKLKRYIVGVVGFEPTTYEHGMVSPFLQFVTGSLPTRFQTSQGQELTTYYRGCRQASMLIPSRYQAALHPVYIPTT